MKTSIAITAFFANATVLKANGQHTIRGLEESMAFSMPNAAVVDGEPEYHHGSGSGRSSSSRSRKGFSLEGHYIACKSRNVSSANDVVVFAATAERFPPPFPLVIKKEGEGEGLYSAVTSNSTPCNTLGIADGDCPNKSLDGDINGFTILKYYHVGARSFSKKKQDEISFVSHYAEYLTGVGGKYESIETLGDKEISEMNLIEEGDTVFVEYRRFLDVTGPQGIAAVTVATSFIYAKEKDGCN